MAQMEGKPSELKLGAYVLVTAPMLIGLESLSPENGNVTLRLKSLDGGNPFVTNVPAGTKLLANRAGAT